jgi:hypothetical protein
VFLAQCACRLDVGEEGMHHHLHRLAMQGVSTLGHSLLLIGPRPRSMSHPSGFVGLHAKIPHLGRFHLHFLETTEERRRQVVQVIHANCLHIYLFFGSTRKKVTDRMEKKPSGPLAWRPLNGTSRSAC